MKAILATALAGSLALSAPCTQAYYHGHGGDALVAGLVGLGVGLAVAAPRTYYYEREPVYYAPREVVVERRYAVPRRIYYYDSYDYWPRHHHYYRRWHDWDD
jgi:hypothetical protein